MQRLMQVNGCLVNHVFNAVRCVCRFLPIQCTCAGSDFGIPPTMVLSLLHSPQAEVKKTWTSEPGQTPVARATKSQTPAMQGLA